MALTPAPVMGTANTLSTSAVDGLVTATFALCSNGHHSGAAPAIDGGVPKGSHGQPSCGEKVTVIEQDCPSASENAWPSEGAPFAPQASVSAKLGRPLKSLCPPNELSPSFVKLNVSPIRAELELFASVIVCVIAADSRVCAGKVISAGVRVIGCWQAVVL